jgi:threonyl-tRNA synthetase
MINVTLKDGSVRQAQEGTTILELASSISPGLARAAVAGKVNGKVKDLDSKLEEDAQVEILTLDSEEGLEVMRHSTSHLLAQAVKNLFPGTILGIGPAIANGFYYDFDSEHTFTPEDLDKLETEMKRLAKEDYRFEYKKFHREKLLPTSAKWGKSIKSNSLMICRQKRYFNLYQATSLIFAPVRMCLDKVLKAFKLQSVAGAYWRGSEKKRCCKGFTAGFCQASDLEVLPV